MNIASKQRHLMSKDMTLLSTFKDIERDIIARKLTKNRSSFCKDWLGHNTSYFGAMHGRKGHATIDTAFRLWLKLVATAQLDLAREVFWAMSEEARKAENIEGVE